VTIDDTLPNNLQILPATITGAQQNGNGIHFAGTLPAALPPNIQVAPGTSPAGYLPLEAFGVPVTASGDDVILNFTLTRSVLYGGEAYSQIAVSSNGLLKLGVGTAADGTPSNQNLPNPATPNNMIAPFWTDLNPGAAAAGDGIRLAVLTDGSERWLVVDWENVPEFSTPSKKHSFEIWMGTNDDATPVEDNTFVFGPTTGNGDGGLLTVGAENKFGNRGNAVYYNGTGTLPIAGSEYRVTGTGAVAAAPKTITFDALGVLAGAWRNCATMTSSTFIGTSFACIDGDVH